MSVAWVVGAGGLLGRALAGELRAHGTDLFAPPAPLAWNDGPAFERQLPECVTEFARRAGVGGSVPHLVRRFPGASLTCADVSRRSLQLAERRFGGRAAFVHHEGHTLPFGDGSFDLAFAACVFHHVPPEEHGKVLAELRRTLRPGGLLVVYEHNPLHPIVRRVVRSCPFDEGAILINASTLRSRLEAAGFSAVRSRFRTFFPRSMRALRPLEERLGWLPLGAQYHATGVKPPGDSARGDR